MSGIGECLMSDVVGSVSQGAAFVQVYKYFRPLVQQSKLKTMVFFASNFGSLTLASEPLRHPEKSSPLDATQIAYKASKAAVNMGEASAQHLKHQSQTRHVCIHSSAEVTRAGHTGINMAEPSVGGS